MTKTFFVVVPYSPPILNSKSGSNMFGSKKAAADVLKEKTADFEEHRTQIEQRASVIQQGLSRCGVRVVQLGTEELIEVFYKLFNPGEMDKPIVQQN